MSKSGIALISLFPLAIIGAPLIFYGLNAYGNELADFARSNFLGMVAALAGVIAFWWIGALFFGSLITKQDNTVEGSHG